MKIMITGAQGSGKTTQAKLLAEKLGVCFIGTGGLLREFAQGSSPESKSVAESLKKGELADDQIVARVVRNKIDSFECQKGFVTDGFPRSLDQLKFFNPDFDKVFYLKISDEEAKKRLLLRGRADDKLEVIEERLGWYHEQVEPLLKYYQDQGRLVVIDGERSIDEIRKSIEESLTGREDAIWMKLWGKLKWIGL